MPAALKLAAPKHATQKILVGFIFAALIVVLLALPQHAATPVSPAAQSLPVSGMDMSLPAGEEAIPAYHKQLPNSPLPATLDPHLFAAQIVQNAYTLAAGIRKLLYQQPCYCHCDRSEGHGSLLDCFAGKHGSQCNVCMAEDFYTYEQSRKGKTAAQIRAGIIAGEWKSVDLTKYQQPLPAK
jgi:hypothetical protein